MKLLRNTLDKFAPLFEKGGKLEKLFPLWEATDTFLYTSGTVTKSASHVRDALDLKRMMVTVVMALTPCVLMALYNTGLQANLALDPAAVGDLTGWRHAILGLLGRRLQSRQRAGLHGARRPLLPAGLRRDPRRRRWLGGPLRPSAQT